MNPDTSPAASSCSDEELLASFGEMPSEEEVYNFDGFRHVVDELRSDHGCDWDRAQTHESLKKYLIEESQEVLDAIDRKDAANFCEELGDLLLQIVLHARLAEEEGLFSMDDVINSISRKMVRRHPHVFGERPRSLTQEENDRLWYLLKQQEKGIHSHPERGNEQSS